MSIVAFTLLTTSYENEYRWDGTTSTSARDQNFRITLVFLLEKREGKREKKERRERIKSGLVKSNHPLDHSSVARNLDRIRSIAVHLCTVGKNTIRAECRRPPSRTSQYVSRENVFVVSGTEGQYLSAAKAISSPLFIRGIAG